MLTWTHSERQLRHRRRDQADHQVERDHQVSTAPGSRGRSPAFLTLGYREDDAKWPQKNKDGRQELEIRLGNDHISFEVRMVHDQARSPHALLTSF